MTIKYQLRRWDRDYKGEMWKWSDRFCKLEKNRKRIKKYVIFTETMDAFAIIFGVIALLT